MTFEILLLILKVICSAQASQLIIHLNSDDISKNYLALNLSIIVFLFACISIGSTHCQMNNRILNTNLTYQVYFSICKLISKKESPLFFTHEAKNNIVSLAQTDIDKLVNLVSCFPGITVGFLKLISYLLFLFVVLGKEFGYSAIITIAFSFAFYTVSTKIGNLSNEAKSIKSKRVALITKFIKAIREVQLSGLGRKVVENIMSIFHAELSVSINELVLEMIFEMKYELISAFFCICTFICKIYYAESMTVASFIFSISVLDEIQQSLDIIAEGYISYLDGLRSHERIKVIFYSLFH